MKVLTSSIKDDDIDLSQKTASTLHTKGADLNVEKLLLKQKEMLDLQKKLP